MRENSVVDGRILPERFHASLCWIGDYDRIPTRVPFAARRAVERVCMPAFDVTLCRAATLPGFRPDDRPTVLLAESDGLRELGATLFDCLRREGLRPGELGMPHVTLFYSPRSIAAADIEPIRFQVDSFHLVHSERGLSRYNLLESRMLGQRLQ